MPKRSPGKDARTPQQKAIAKAVAAASKKKLTSKFIVALRTHGLATGIEVEYAFHPTRKWRFDYAYPHAKVAIELDGGVWAGKCHSCGRTGGRHQFGAGFLTDMDKFNNAAGLGWRVIRFGPNHLDDPAGIAATITEALKNEQ